MTASAALQVAQALLAITREERGLIDGGRLEELADLVVRRAEVIGQLDRVLGRPVPADVADVLRATREEAARNLSLLRVAQDEIAREIAGDTARTRALNSYNR